MNKLSNKLMEPSCTGLVGGIGSSVVSSLAIKPKLAKRSSPDKTFSLPASSAGPTLSLLVTEEVGAVAADEGGWRVLSRKMGLFLVRKTGKVGLMGELLKLLVVGNLETLLLDGMTLLFEVGLAKGKRGAAA